jgi:hypothetical protein
MCNQKITDYDLAPSRKMDAVLKDIGKEPKVIRVLGVITLNSDGELKILGFTVRRGKKK